MSTRRFPTQYPTQYPVSQGYPTKTVSEDTGFVRFLGCLFLFLCLFILIVLLTV